MNAKTRAAVWTLAAVALAAAGCGRPQATIRYVAGGPDETVTYSSTTYQLARGQKVQVVLFRRTAAPIGEADPDFEYVFFELPERARSGWVKEDNMPVYRWVREGHRDQVWAGTTGQARQTSGDSKQHLHLDFQVTMEPVAGTTGPYGSGLNKDGAYLMTGNIKCAEDMVMTQGLINKYGDWLLSLLGQKPQAPPGGPTVKSLQNFPKPKPSQPKKTEPRPSTGLQHR